MTKTNTLSGRRPLDAKILRHVQRDRRIRRALPAHLVPAAISSPTHGPMRRDGALTRFLDLTRDA
jgi:hypothetical protein